MLTFTPLKASREQSPQKNSRDSFHNSYSSPELLNESGDYGESSGLQVHLEPEEKAFLPMFGSKDSGTIQMKGDYLSREAIPEWGLRGKHYLSSDDRKDYEITFKNQVYRDSSNNLLHGEYLYIMLPNDKLYGCKPGTQRFHSYLSSGLNVKAAGILYCHYGVIATVSNESGHYKPTLAEMIPALALLNKNSTAPLIFEDHSKLDETLPFQGVKHFEVCIENKALSLLELNPVMLKEKIDSSIDYAQKLFTALPFNTLVNSEPTLTSSSDYNIDAYYDSGEERDPNHAFMSTDTPAEQQYLKLSCLWRMNNPDSSSRFLGMTKLK